MLGQVNAGTMLERADVVNKLLNRTRNALFSAAFGLNAGLYASSINYFKSFGATASQEMDLVMNEMMDNLMNALYVIFKNLFDLLLTYQNYCKSF